MTNRNTQKQLDRPLIASPPPASEIITPEIRKKLAGMRVLLVGGHPEAPLERIYQALTGAGLQVTWERNDMDLIPKNFDLLGLRAENLLRNNTHLFDVVIVDWRKPPWYEWAWSPFSIFSKFEKGKSLRIGIGPKDKLEEQLGQGADLFFDYGKFLADDLEPLLFILAAEHRMKQQAV